MNEEIEFLEYIYQNAKICQETIARIIKNRNKKDELENVIKTQYFEYKKISNSAKNMLERRKKKVNEEISVMAKIVTYMEIKKNIAKENDVTEIVCLLIEGSKVGIEQISTRLNEIKVTNKPVLNLANRLINIEKNNIEELKKYVESNDINIDI